jgi:Arc/MetJ-type ribon-helix-helix transcriptional regulator
VKRGTTAAALRQYRAEWKAAWARRDYAKTRTILAAAMATLSRETTDELDLETRALHELLALDRRLESIATGEGPSQLPPARQAFEAPSTRGFRDQWQRAVDRADYGSASSVVREAIASVSRQLARRTRSQQALIERLRRLQRRPLEFRSVPMRCALCGGTEQPGVDSGRLFICTDCVLKANEILAEHARDVRDKAT